MDNTEITMTRRLYNRRLMNDRGNSVGMGLLAQGIQSFGVGFETGISDIIMKPIKGANKKGIQVN